MLPSGKYRSSKKSYDNRNEKFSPQLLEFFKKKVTLFSISDLENEEIVPVEKDDSVTAVTSNLSTKVPQKKFLSKIHYNLFIQRT
jgi:hypothetical protein